MYCDRSTCNRKSVLVEKGASYQTIDVSLHNITRSRTLHTRVHIVLIFSHSDLFVTDSEATKTMTDTYIKPKDNRADGKPGKPEISIKALTVNIIFLNLQADCSALIGVAQSAQTKACAMHASTQVASL